MHSPNAILGSFVFLLLAPGFVAGGVPVWISRWQISPPLVGFSWLRIVGVLLILAGLSIMACLRH
jgi:hypothetical protein